ncbi:MAG: hypothetical protein ACREDH_02300, partial [Methylocella sp.]
RKTFRDYPVTASKKPGVSRIFAGIISINFFSINLLGHITLFSGPFKSNRAINYPKNIFMSMSIYPASRTEIALPAPETLDHAHGGIEGCFGKLRAGRFERRSGHGLPVGKNFIDSGLVVSTHDPAPQILHQLRTPVRPAELIDTRGGTH